MTSSYLSLTRQQLNRALVCLSALGCLIAGLLIGIFDSWDENIWCGSFIRAGLLLGAFWVGMPTRGRAAAWANMSPWALMGIVGAVFFVMRRPQVLVPLASILIFLVAIAPLFTQRPKS